MLLLVDIGNSWIKWSTPEALRQGRSNGGSCHDLQGILQNQWSDIPRPAQVWVSNVARVDVIEQLSDWVGRVWELSPILVKSLHSQLGVINGYRNPAQLGVDRWLAMLCARAISSTACLVVDCGTATTIDSLDTQGRHLGGMILPGVQSMQEVLISNTAIQTTGDTVKYCTFAKDTNSAVSSAATLATCCLIERAARRLQSHVGSEVSCILTGGAAAQLNGLLELDLQYEPNLVLNGLALVAAQSTDS